MPIQHAIPKLCSYKKIMEPTLGLAFKKIII